MKVYSPDKQSHLPVLDGVRGMAILMVLIFHFWQGTSVYHHQFSKHVGLLLSLCSIGQKGVDLFFVLSGFLITGILLRTKGSPNYFRNFYARRALRIFPLYYAVVIGCLLAGIWFSIPRFSWPKDWWYLLYLQNVGMTFWPGSVSGPGHFWSLAVEEHFYLFWPLVVLLFNRRNLVWVSLGLTVLAIAIRCIFLRMGYDVFTFTLCRMDALAIGCFLAVLFSHPVYWKSVVSWSRRLVVPVVALLFSSFFVFSGEANTIVQAVKYTLFAVMCAFVLVLSLSEGTCNPLPKVFQAFGLRYVGKISYSMYVFHPFIYGHILGKLYYSSWSPCKGMVWPSMILELIISVTLVFIASSISWIAFEKPLVKLKDRFSYEDRQGAIARNWKLIA
jgi:peptidoglycan/LPS O-acetylase OafA/YrhL